MPPETDTSFYKNVQQPDPLAMVGKLQNLQQGAQAIQQNNINIDKSKLDLAYKGMEYMTGEINSLPPDAKPQDVFKVLQNAVNQKFLTPEAYAQAVKEVPGDNDPQAMAAYKDRYIARAQHALESLKYYAGETGTATDNRQTYQTRTSPRPGFGVQINPNPIATTKLGAQTQETQDNPNLPNYGQPRYTAPSGGPLVQPSGTPPINTNPLPVGSNQMPNGSTRTVGPNTAGLPVQQPQQPTPAQTVQNRFPGPAAGLPPGAGEAETIAGQASGTAHAQARNRMANFQRDIYPLTQAIPALEKLGTKGTGPGTETTNHLKSFILSMVPGIKETDPAFESVPTYDKAKKYLVQIASESGNTGTNDKLAATFAGNPSVGISNAAASDVAKSIYTLKRMQQSLDSEFERSGQPSANYSKWMAQRSNEIDSRAFGVDLLKPEAKTKLREDLAKAPKSERQKFERSLELAHSGGFIAPSGQ